MTYNRKPINFNFSKKHSGIEMFFDITKNELVNDIGYLCENESYDKKLLEKFCADAIGKNFNDIRVTKDHKNDNFIAITEIILACVRSEWNGIPVPWNQQKGKDLEKLVCRCFGVYLDEIVNYFEENPLNSLLDLTNSLKAGGGCTSCLFDIEKTQIEFRKKINLVTNEKRNRYKGLTPAEAIMKVQNILRAHLSDCPEIKELRKRHIILDGERDEFAPKLIKEIDCELKKELGLKVIFSSEDSPYYIS